MGSQSPVSIWKIWKMLVAELCVLSLKALQTLYPAQSPAHANASQWLRVLRMYSYAFLYTPVLLLFFPTFTTSRSFLHHHLPHVI